MFHSRMLLAGLLACSLSAQTAEEKSKMEAKLKAEKRAAEIMSVVSSGVGGSIRLVTDKPFAAEAITETVQILADGNRIERRNVTRHYRDRSGRTRREQILETLGPASPVALKEIVLISDPHTNVEYVVDTTTKTVRKISRLGTPMPGNTRPESSEVRKEDLGRRTIEGLECTGKRTTLTIPAGRIGNVRPIVAVTEEWYSSAIEAVVQSTTKDPRFGETNYSLGNVRLVDQPAQLFEPPPDFRMESDSKL